MVSQGQWVPRASAGHQDYKDSQDYKAAKVTKASGALPGRQDPKETWAQEAFLDSRVLTEFPDIRARAGPGGGPATMAATEPGATQAPRDPPALQVSPAHPGPKDQKDRKVNHTHYLEKTATNTGAKLESPGWSVFRALPATPGLWGRWVQLDSREDQGPLDLLGRKDSRATEDLVFMEKRVKRATRACRDPTGFRQTPLTPLLHPQAPQSTPTCIRVKREVGENQER